VKTRSGEIWHDREELAWVDPFQKEVWDYNIDIAVEAAQHGFDEISLTMSDFLMQLASNSLCQILR
jgi:hypothetical protein